MRRAAAVTVAAGLAGALVGPARAQDAGTVVFALPAGLEEVSGMALGAGGALYVHQDSGSEAVLTALDPVTGGERAAYDLGVDARDWEDMAAGPGDTLLVADIGDNSSARDMGVLVHELAAPTGPSAATPPTRSVRLVYEDGPRDAEALLVHPRTGQVLVVTKFAGLVMAAPEPFGPGTLTRVGAVEVRGTGTPGGPLIGAAAQRLITGGAVSPDGRRVAVRTYTDAYLYEVPGDDLVAALATEPTVVPLPETEQGEALTWTADSAALLTSSEGAGAQVHRVPAPAGAPVQAGDQEPVEPEPVQPVEPDRLPLVLAGATVLAVLLVGAGAVLRSRR